MPLRTCSPLTQNGVLISTVEHTPATQFGHNLTGQLPACYSQRLMAILEICGSGKLMATLAHWTGNASLYRAPTQILIHPDSDFQDQSLPNSMEMMPLKWSSRYLPTLTEELLVMELALLEWKSPRRLKSSISGPKTATPMLNLCRWTRMRMGFRTGYVG